MPPRHRPDLTEIMDEPDVDSHELAANLGDLRAFNTVFRWRRRSVDRLEQMVAPLRHHPIRILDVGTGTADIPLDFLRRQGPARLRFRVYVGDAGDLMLRIARSRPGASHLRPVRLDACHLPFPDGSFDVAMMNTALHHFPPREAVQALAEMGRVAHRILVADLERSWFGMLTSRLAPLVTRNRLTRHDGPASVLRAYTEDEMLLLAHQAGLSHVRVRRAFPSRLILTARGLAGL